MQLHQNRIFSQFNNDQYCTSHIRQRHLYYHLHILQTTINDQYNFDGRYIEPQTLSDIHATTDTDKLRMR